ncbi:MAG: hypothetical protein IJY42_02175 [Clostridia bacterium]|nr:hypothetical protein [Clostridia bacterium]
MKNNVLSFSDTLYIAAVDSLESDKQLANYVCEGQDDQDVIQAAVDSIAFEKNGEIRGIRIVLLPGNYYISAFPRENKNGRVAVMIGNATNRFTHIGILITGSEYTESTVIHVTQSAYDSVKGDESCSVFGCASGSDINWNHHVFAHLYVTVPDDQKNIICFDGRYMGSMGLRRCKCLCETRGSWGDVKATLPVEGFVAFMGTYGSNNSWEQKWENCQAEGFGQGFAIGSEHLLLQKCVAVFGRYGFTFNNYPCAYGVVAHPITMIYCGDEANANLWKFAKNKYKQCVKAYNISFERVPGWIQLGGRYTVEENPGDYVGHIDYVANDGYETPNRVDMQFWEEGCGINFETVNNTHKKLCTTAERQSYYPQLGQELFDTDLQKKLIYTADGWRDMMGNPVS